MSDAATDFELAPIQASSVVSLAYERIRALILNGEIPAGARLAQVALAEQLGVSRTPVREALRRLAGDGLVDFEDQRGFRVAAPRLHDVLKRLDVRLILEPAVARLAAQRRNEADLAGLQASIERERRAETSIDAHDASRQFHMHVAGATENHELVLTLDNLWHPEIGRRLLSQRRVDRAWQDADVREHQQILDAIRERDADAAAALMEEHIRAALQHWQPELDRHREAP